MGSLRGTIPCSFKRKIGGQLWCLILAKRKSPVFRAKKTGNPVASWIQADIRRKKKIVKSSCRTCRPPVKNWREKRWKKKHTSFLKYRRKNNFCARNIRGFLFIRKNSCSRLRFGNSFRYSKQKEKKKKKFRQNRKKYVKNTNFLLRPYMKRRVFDKKCFTLRVFINLW